MILVDGKTTLCKFASEYYDETKEIARTVEEQIKVFQWTMIKLRSPMHRHRRDKRHLKAIETTVRAQQEWMDRQREMLAFRRRMFEEMMEYLSSVIEERSP